MSVFKFFLYTIFIFVFGSCAFHANSWQGDNPPGKNKAAFTNFRGKEVSTVKINEGDFLLFSYNIEIKSGSLLVYIEKNKTRLWQKQFSVQTDSGEIRLHPVEPGEYKVVVVGKDAAGSFDLNYKSAAIEKKSDQGK